MMIGGGACLVLLLFFAVNVFFMKSSFVSQGPLSSAHANFEQNCSQCHESFKSVSSSRCSLCHEKAGDKTGSYSFAAHYVYRSGDAAHGVAVREKYAGKEVTCASCHPDHRGRDGSMTEVPDMKCISCHDYGSFNKNHPEFAFARNQIPDDSTLIFTHIRHTKFVLEKQQAGALYVEKACLYCHNPEGDGKHFKPIDFDQHCAECHLTSASQTPPLAVKDAGNPGIPGVETLQMIIARRGPASLWASSTNPNEFTMKAGNRIVKTPVYHKDPWILENLRMLRQSLYGDLGLSELLQASADGARKPPGRLYAEAISTLRSYITGLRSRPEPEIQSDLAILDSLVKASARRTQAINGLSSSAFSLAAMPIVAPEPQKQDFLQFADRLTTPCRVCHTLSNASILGVNADQRKLMRAEFDHRAHILQRRCLECHTEIPINQVVVNKDTSAQLVARDRSAIQNLPKISMCAECHNQSEASNKCTTCHYMHPNKNNRSSLQLFVERN